MARDYYATLERSVILASPQNYTWNCVLYYIQFTQDELLQVKDWLDIIAVIKYQQSASYRFLESYFTDEINEASDINWDEIKKYTHGR
jgi:transposase